MKTEENEIRIRYSLPDSVRGILVLGMIAYHTLFDIAVVYGIGTDTPFFRTVNVFRDIGAACFVFLSGFCFHFGKHNARKGLILLFAGLAVTGATYFFDSESFVVFGVLTFLGFAKLLLCALDRPFRSIPPTVGVTVSFFLFQFFFQCNFGYLGIGYLSLLRLPSFLYRDYITAFFGFPFTGFSSADYFGLLPWFFIDCCGWFFYRAASCSNHFPGYMSVRLPIINSIGRYSLPIYLFHQPVLYFVVWATKKLFL